MILKLKYYLDETPNKPEYDVAKKGYIISIDVDSKEVKLVQDKEKLNKIGKYATEIENSLAFIDTTKKITKTVFYPVLFNGNEPTPKDNDQDPIYTPFIEFLLNKRSIKNKEIDIKLISKNHSFKKDNLPKEIVDEIEEKFGEFTNFQYINEQYLNNLKKILKNPVLGDVVSEEFVNEVKKFIINIGMYEKENPKSNKYQYVKLDGEIKTDGTKTISHYFLSHYSLRLPKLRIYLNPPKEYLKNYFNNSEEEFLDFFYKLTIKKRKVKEKRMAGDSEKETCPLCQEKKDLSCSNFETNSAGERTYLFQNLDKNNIRFKVCSDCNDKLLHFNKFIRDKKVFLVKFNSIHNSEDAKKYKNEFISTYSNEINESRDRYQTILSFIDKQIETVSIFDGSLIIFDGKSTIFDDYYIKNKTTPINDEEINMIQLNQWINSSNEKKLKHHELYRIIKRCFFSESSYWFTRDLSKNNQFYKAISKYINNNYGLLKEIYSFNFEKVNQNAFCVMSINIYFFYLQSYLSKKSDSEDEKKKKKNLENLKLTLRNFPNVFSFLLKKIIFKEDKTMNTLQTELIKLKQIGRYLGEIDSQRTEEGKMEDEKKQIITQLDITNYDALIFSLVKIFDRYKHIEIKKNNSYSSANDILIKNKEIFKNDKVLFSEAVMYIISGYLENVGGN